MILKALTFALAPQLNVKNSWQIHSCQRNDHLRDPLKAQSLDQSQLFDQPRKSSLPWWSPFEMTQSSTLKKH